jgi:hypothetical protein
MGLTYIYPVSSTTRTTRVDHRNSEVSLAHEMREQPTAVAITVTSCAGETNFPSVSPEEISDHPTGQSSKISFAPRPTKMFPWPAFDAITIPPAQDLPSFLQRLITLPQVLCPHLYLVPTGHPINLPTRIG